MLKNRVMYIPAISVGTYRQSMIKNDKKDDFSFRFYDPSEKVFFRYPYLMVSAGHTLKKMDFREDINFPRDSKHVFVGDSGGFQFAKGVLDVAEIVPIRKNIFDWLEKNCDRALTLDIPPFVTGESSGGSESRFRERAELTRQNNEFFEKHTSGEVDYINILHGRDVSQQEYWYKKAMKDFQFQGVSVGSWSNLKHVLLGIMFLLERGELEKHKFLHLLGVSRTEWLLYLNFVQKMLNIMDIDIQLTTDSSTPFSGAAFGMYILMMHFSGFFALRLTNVKRINTEDLPEEATIQSLQGEIIDLSQRGSGPRDQEKKERRGKDWNPDLRMPCICPVCLRYPCGDFTEWNTISYNLICLHNFFKILEFQTVAERLVDHFEPDHERFPVPDTCNKGTCNTRINKNLKVIKKAMESKKPYDYIRTQFFDNVTLVRWPNLKYEGTSSLSKTDLRQWGKK